MTPCVCLAGNSAGAVHPRGFGSGTSVRLFHKHWPLRCCKYHRQHELQATASVDERRSDGEMPGPPCVPPCRPALPQPGPVKMWGLRCRSGRIPNAAAFVVLSYPFPLLPSSVPAEFNDGG